MANGEWSGLSGTKDGKIAAWHAFELSKWPTDSPLDGCPFLAAVLLFWCFAFLLFRLLSLYYLQAILAIISFGSKMFSRSQHT